jgi:hypothetical protein
MKKVINDIVIVGGGSSGWISASILSNQFKNKKITVIESPNIPIIGVGESTLANINQLLGLLDLKDEDWMPYCNATYKLAIKFTDFYKKGESFYYPFGMKDLTNTKFGINDWYMIKSQKTDLPVNHFYESYYSSMPIIYKNKINNNTNGEIPNFNFKLDSAYHMDATLFGEFLKNNYCKKRGVTLIQKEVKDIIIEEDGYIKSIVLDDEEEIFGDLFLDCTGFKSLLLEKKLGVEFETFTDLLPNNKAWTCHIPYTETEKEMENVTNCTAIENGWVWNIPLFNRIGSGYVYSDKFITDEQALEEYKKHLDGTNMVSYNPNRSKDLDFKKIDIRTGIHNKVWYKNCIGVGLSYGFIEPLESTGLLLVQDVLFKITEILQKEIVSKWDVDSLNFVFKNKMDTFKKFIAYHYVLSSRRDTEYWRDVTENMTINPNLLELKHSPSDNSAEFAFNKLETNQYNSSAGGIVDVFTGMHHFPFTKITLELSKIISGNPNLLWLNQLQGYWDLKRNNIERIVYNSPSHYKYLRENIHKNTPHVIRGNFNI